MLEISTAAEDNLLARQTLLTAQEHLAATLEKLAQSLNQV